MIKQLTPFKFILIFGIIFSACEPIVNKFDDIEDAVMYRANTITDVSAQSTVKVMTWNIRFGVARLRFFGDGCGDRVVLKKSEVIKGLEGLAAKIKQIGRASSRERV